MDIITATVSLQGNRGNNQDRSLAISDEQCALLLLADGMGGHPKGEVAAQIVVDTGRTAFESASKPISDPLGFLEDILQSAHEQIVAYGKAQEPPIDPRATAVAALVQNDNTYWLHAGDSRAYLFRGYRIERRTKDHSFVEHMRGRGLMKKGDPKEKRYRNLVTQCLGGAGIRFGTTRSKPAALIPHDIILLCTDGLWSQIPEEQLGPNMRHHGSLERMVHDLAEKAQQAAAPASDNITLVALRWLGQDASNKTTADTTTLAPADDQEDLRDAIDYLRSAIDEFKSDK